MVEQAFSLQRRLSSRRVFLPASKTCPVKGSVPPEGLLHGAIFLWAPLRKPSFSKFQLENDLRIQPPTQ